MGKEGVAVGAAAREVQTAAAAVGARVAETAAARVGAREGGATEEADGSVETMVVA